ncbi:hypothetical protein BHE90_008145 [Fusarium euwallaceae]|uniref:Uncharacterized protein n=4 Tax=Fusarium solani species complex TaxID=232080 RepID=A0A3M2S1A3_9HYPO|nr:hypothetical protein CDV36_009067 [Fusarium kuroshium]RSL69527.1 hypothetical protein CEP51_012333 [Fusarium floridanum]RSM03976.1 hypothetical protein CDV31_010239 [Fusarium ambrosium]RTE77384.1 hypothetical protein BHE90_008145 [Fusarium euwallaceae]
MASPLFASQLLQQTLEMPGPRLRLAVRRRMEPGLSTHRPTYRPLRRPGLVGLDLPLQLLAAHSISP